METVAYTLEEPAEGVKFEEAVDDDSARRSTQWLGRGRPTRWTRSAAPARVWGNSDFPRSTLA